jgi:hypothetical protein
MYRSDDKGETWQELRTGLPERFDVMVSGLAEGSDGEIYAVAGNELYLSENGGDQWRRLSENFPRTRALITID